MADTAIAYLRISSDPMEERLGVERQHADVQRLAKRLGVELTEIFEDNDVSAYKERRATSAWARALAVIERDRPRYMLVYRQDRIGRRLADVEGLEELCRRTNTRVHAVDGGDVFANAAWPVLAAVAKMESQNTSARVRRAMGARRASGKPNGGGRRPYGYQADRVTPIREEVAVLRDIGRRVIAGESLMSIVDDLNALAVPTVTRRARWRVTVLRGMLENPRYVGDLTHRGEVVGTGSWPPVFDRATWEALQAALPRVQQAPHGKKAVSLLAGIARCARCHGPMVSSGWTGRQTYRCNRSVGGCGRTSRNRALVDEWVTAELLQRFSREVLADERSSAKQELRRAQRAYDEVRWRIEDARVAHEEGRLEGREFYPIYDGLRRQRESLGRKLAEARTRVEAASQAPAARQQWHNWTVAKRRIWIQQRVVAVVIWPPGQGRHAIQPGDVEIVYAGVSRGSGEAHGP